VILVASLLCAVSARADASEAQDILSLRLQGIEVTYHPGDAGLARQTAAAVQSASERILSDLGIALPEPVTVSLARGRDEFAQETGSSVRPWALAMAVGPRNAIVVDVTLVTPSTANDLNPTLFHEAVHLALFQVERTQATPLPLWFHEGTATWLSERRHLIEDRSTFRLAAARGDLIPFDTLERSFPAEQPMASLAYAQSEAFIAHIAASRSVAALQWILGRYHAVEAFEEAFENALGVSRPAMERRWRASLRRRFPWVKTIWEVTTLFGVLALATILVFLIVRGRARRQKQRWLEEERLWTVVGDDDDEEADDDAYSS